MNSTPGTHHHTMSSCRRRGPAPGRYAPVASIVSAPPAAEPLPEPDCYTPAMVRRYLEFGGEMEELYRAAFIVSSWPSRDLRSATGVRSYPARFGLLSSKWDMDWAICQLDEFPRAVLDLRYRAHWTHERIGRLLSCSRSRVWHTLDWLPHALTDILNGGEVQ